MPRSRGSEVAQPPPPPPPQQQRQSPRAPLHLRTTNSDPNGVHAHHRSSPKLEDSHRRSPRSPLPEFSSCNQKRRVGRVADLETKLSHVQEELGKLREQLASAEAAKRDAQHELEEAKKKVTPAAAVAVGGEQAEEPHVSAELHGGEHLVEAASPAEDKKKADSPDITVVPAAASVDPVIGKEGDSADYVLLEDKDEGAADGIIAIDEKEGKGEEEEAAAAAAMAEAGAALTLQEAPVKPALEAKLEETIGELERCLAENAGLKKQLEEAEASAAAARSREEETALKLTHAEEELAGSKAKADRLGEQLEAAEGAKASLEAEMKRLKIQSEQWRKAADAAVAALSVTGGLGADGRRLAERCGSMDKHLGTGYTGEFSGLGSPMIAADDLDDRWGAAAGKRKSAASIRMFGDLWKKKGQQK